MDNIVPIVAAFDAYANWDGLYIKGGHYSVTDLLNPPRIVQLLKRYKDKLPPQGIEDMVATFQGNAWHAFFEKNLRAAASKPEWRNRFLVESKFWERVEGRKITGKLDCYDALTKTLYDFKVTSTFKAIFGDYTDWEIQLNAYAWFLKMNNFEVERIHIVCIHPAWNKFEMMRDPKYPRKQIHEIPLRVWPFEEQEEFIKARVRAMRDSETAPDDELPECTDKDMWVKVTKVAIMEPGKKKATRLADSEEDALEYIRWREEQGKPIKDYTLDKREGERTRCLNYCRVSEFCNQHMEYLMERAG